MESANCSSPAKPLLAEQSAAGVSADVAASSSTPPRSAETSSLASIGGEQQQVEVQVSLKTSSEQQQQRPSPHRLQSNHSNRPSFPARSSTADTEKHFNTARTPKHANKKREGGGGGADLNLNVVIPSSHSGDGPVEITGAAVSMAATPIGAPPHPRDGITSSSSRERSGERERGGGRAVLHRPPYHPPPPGSGGGYPHPHPQHPSHPPSHHPPQHPSQHPQQHPQHGGHYDDYHAAAPHWEASPNPYESHHHYLNPVVHSTPRSSSSQHHSHLDPRDPRYSDPRSHHLDPRHLHSDPRMDPRLDPRMDPRYGDPRYAPGGWHPQHPPHHPQHHHPADPYYEHERHRMGSAGSARYPPPPPGRDPRGPPGSGGPGGGYYNDYYDAQPGYYGGYGAEGPPPTRDPRDFARDNHGGMEQRRPEPRVDPAREHAEQTPSRQFQREYPDPNNNSSNHRDRDERDSSSRNLANSRDRGYSQDSLSYQEREHPTGVPLSESKEEDRLLVEKSDRGRGDSLAGNESRGSRESKTASLHAVSSSFSNEGKSLKDSHNTISKSLSEHQTPERKALSMPDPTSASGMTQVSALTLTEAEAEVTRGSHGRMAMKQSPGVVTHGGSIEGSVGKESSQTTNTPSHLTLPRTQHHNHSLPNQPSLKSNDDASTSDSSWRQLQQIASVDKEEMLRLEMNKSELTATAESDSNHSNALTGASSPKRVSKSIGDESRPDEGEKEDEGNAVVRTPVKEDPRASSAPVGANTNQDQVEQESPGDIPQAPSGLSRTSSLSNSPENDDDRVATLASASAMEEMERYHAHHAAAVAAAAGGYHGSMMHHPHHPSPRHPSHHPAHSGARPPHPHPGERASHPPPHLHPSRLSKLGTGLFSVITQAGAENNGGDDNSPSASTISTKASLAHAPGGLGPAQVHQQQVQQQQQPQQPGFFKDHHPPTPNMKPKHPVHVKKSREDRSSSNEESSSDTQAAKRRKLSDTSSELGAKPNDPSPTGSTSSDPAIAPHAASHMALDGHGRSHVALDGRVMAESPPGEHGNSGNSIATGCHSHHSHHSQHSLELGAMPSWETAGKPMREWSVCSGLTGIDYGSLGKDGVLSAFSFSEGFKGDGGTPKDEVENNIAHHHHHHQAGGGAIGSGIGGENSNGDRSPGEGSEDQDPSPKSILSKLGEKRKSLAPGTHVQFTRDPSYPSLEVTTSSSSSSRKRNHGAGMPRGPPGGPPPEEYYYDYPPRHAAHPYDQYRQPGPPPGARHPRDHPMYYPEEDPYYDHYYGHPHHPPPPYGYPPRSGGRGGRQPPMPPPPHEPYPPPHGLPPHRAGRPTLSTVHTPPSTSTTRTIHHPHHPHPHHHLPPTISSAQFTHIRSGGQQSGWEKEDDQALMEIMKKFKNPKNWEPIAKKLNRGKSPLQCQERWTRYLKPGSRKGQWTDDEDAIVVDAVQNSVEDPFTRWSDLAQKLPGRVGKQVRDRWVNHLNPAINHLPFSREDDLMLWDGHHVLGKRWVEISSKYFKGARSENHIKNRWYSASFKKFIAKEFGPDAYRIGNECAGTGGTGSVIRKGAIVPAHHPQHGLIMHPQHGGHGVNVKQEEGVSAPVISHSGTMPRAL